MEISKYLFTENGLLQLLAQDLNVSQLPKP